MFYMALYCLFLHSFYQFLIEEAVQRYENDGTVSKTKVQFNVYSIISMY